MQHPSASGSNFNMKPMSDSCHSWKSRVYGTPGVSDTMGHSKGMAFFTPTAEVDAPDSGYFLQVESLVKNDQVRLVI